MSHHHRNEFISSPHLIALIAFLSVVSMTRSVVAQVQPANPDSALQIILAQMQGTSLTLSGAVQHALREAAAVRQAEAAYVAAQAVVRREKGYFDPRLFISLNYLEDRLPTASFFAGAPVLVTQQTSAESGLRLNLPTGAQLEASINAVRIRTNSIFAFLNPQYTTLGLLSLRQPLMSGFNISARKDLTKAERELEAARARYDQATLAIRAEVERGYWDLYAASRDYAVQWLIRDNAEALAREAELRVKTGLVGPKQVASAQVFLAEQELGLLEREEQLDRFSDQLASLIGSKPEAGQPRFLATDEPPGEFPLESAEALVKNALENNFDLHAARKEIEAARTLARAAKWEALPQVDLVGSLGGNGLSGNAQDVIFGGDTLLTDRGGSVGSALDQAIKQRFSTWAVGVEINIPIGLHGGSGERQRLQSETIKAEERYIAEGRALEEQVRANYRELFHGKRRLEVARMGVKAAEEQVRIGLIEFHNGRSTAFELVRLGADFGVAQQRYSQALVRTAKAAATLRQLTSGGYPASTLSGDDDE